MILQLFGKIYETTDSVTYVENVGQNIIHCSLCNHTCNEDYIYDQTKT